MPSITDLCLDIAFPTQRELIDAWLPEIQEAALLYAPQDPFLAFFFVAMRLAAKAEGFSGLNLKSLVYHAGYSRSTFYRLFDGYSAFLLDVYQLARLLGIKIYKKHLIARAMDLEGFIEFSINFIYSANAALPADLCKMLWEGRNVEHIEFHPHLTEAANVVVEYLNTNPQTSHMNIRFEDIFELLRMLDWDMLKAFIDEDPKCPSRDHYMHLKRLFRGYILQLADLNSGDGP